jgi:secondary thiamine-phosphate synthase enzyme
MALAPGALMKMYTSEIHAATQSARQLVDITSDARAHVQRSAVANGICSLYAQGATAALMVQENDDPNIALDVLDCLDQVAPAGVWRHDRVDNNGASHIQAGLVGPSETIPIRDGRLALSTWQNVFLCDFDGPRSRRIIVVTIVGE